MFSIEHRLNNASVEVAEYSDGKPEALDSEGSNASRLAWCRSPRIDGRRTACHSDQTGLESELAAF